MLSKLTIQNYALIKSLELTPGQNLNVITGETGAGKSIMLGAIGLLLGNRADSKALYDDSTKCVIEGHFDLSQHQISNLFDEEDIDFETETIIRREITASGKSRAFVNDTPVRLDFLKVLGSHLVDIHSQHENLALSSKSFQYEVLDEMASTIELKKQYQSTYAQWVVMCKKLESLKEDQAQQLKEYEFNKFQFEELKEAQLDDLDYEEYKKSLDLGENAEVIIQSLQKVAQSLDLAEPSISEQLYELVGSLEQIEEYSSNYKTLSERLKSALYELKDIASESDRESQNVEYDPEQLSEVKDRLDLINRLLIKHQTNEVAELILLRDQLEDQIRVVDNFDSEMQQLEQDATVQLNSIKKIGKDLSEQRKKAAPVICGQFQELLSQLGMPDAVLDINIQESEPSIEGLDDVAFMFSANKGISPQPIQKVASGGEFSRLMFVVKYLLASATKLPTLIFDEVDTGISGEIAVQMGQMMETMSKEHQLITITHLPQIASMGDHHYFVYKATEDEKATSKIKELGTEERVIEVAQMIGGFNPSQTAKDSARELLKLS